MCIRDRASSELFQDIGEVGLIARRLVLWQVFLDGEGEGGGEIGGNNLGVEVLTDGFGEFAGELLDQQAVLQGFEGFFDIPLKMPP